ncbi:hypothetical protein K08M3_18260 [Vibrio alginolyticus]|uniref:Uncharacterized protein n=1 Tax=Vibrio alginolyticus TaxID=663 RepID=A0A1W6TS50_VIBAL|nr:hypothetical protein K01M1_18230 [Vibrio alginolyticus]ARP03481.1 hypothetical protein K04M1_18350 [Vibrio alginolyticus]ARP08539.1 hypothetical protein K04M3_18380 [Vibrio alginolyticus]ARP13614.1 hypothetical protein K04M5_18260 [Vibrio alginolyticus]ARP18674.1 hypothetical protein K05K4_18400 [Vibrio alginolyticus]
MLVMLSKKPLKLVRKPNKNTAVYFSAEMIFLFTIFVKPLDIHNALLRGEQRNTDAAAYHLKH